MSTFSVKVKGFLATKGVGYFLTLPAAALCVVAFCLYIDNGVTSFNPELNTAAIAYAVVCLVLCIVSLCIDFAPIKPVVKPIKYIAYLLCLYAFMWFLYSQVTYIANVFVAIDGYTFTGGFIATVVFYVLSFVFVLLSAIMNSWQPWKKKESNDVVNDGSEMTETAEVDR